MRVEYKYIIAPTLTQQVFDLLDYTLVCDQHCIKNGYYNVSSLYYDTEDFDFYYEKIEGEFHHRKARIRTYGLRPFDGTCFFEIKYKYNENSYKKRMILFDCAKSKHTTINNSEILSNSRSSLGYELQLSDLTNIQILGIKPIFPVCHVLYKRKAYHLNTHQGKVRVNLDWHIVASTQFNDYNCIEDYVFPKGHIILEIKAPSRNFFSQLGELLELITAARTTFSKYICAVNVLHQQLNYGERI